MTTVTIRGGRFHELLAAEALADELKKELRRSTVEAHRLAEALRQAEPLLATSTSRIAKEEIFRVLRDFDVLHGVAA